MNKLRLLLFTLLAVGSIVAQDLSKLTPEQLEMYKKYMSGKSSSVTNTTDTQKDNVEVRKLSDPDSTGLTKPQFTPAKSPMLTVFGSYLFSSQNLTFEPKLNIPTPSKYMLGTYDELVIDVSGLYEVNYKLKVSPEGIVRIPNVGPVKVAGLTMEEATRLIRNQVAKVYMGVSSGETKVNVSLGDIRSIRVTVVGEAVRPGTYTLPSLATAFNALYVCGGPNSIGTMRDIKVIRDGKVVARLDVYQFLVDGLLNNNVGLQDEDIIRIDPYQIRTSINGAVKRIGIFEATKGETLQNLIRYAGGYADNAFKEKVTAYRLTKNEKTVIDVTDDKISSFQLVSGDSIVVNTTLNRYNNKIDIVGAVFRPGSYALETGLTIKQLIDRAGGLKEDAYLKIASITRKKENQIPENIGFHPGNVLNGTAPDILLQKDDRIEIKSLFDFRETQSVSIIGEVRAPGAYTFIDNLTLKDLIFKAKGFTEMAAPDSVELVRVIKDQYTLLNTNQKTTVQKFALDNDFNFKNGVGDVLLENKDQVIVRRISGYEGIRIVRVEGEVIYPGSYNITNKAEKVSDVITRAGGFTAYAYPRGGFLIRAERTNDIERKLLRIMQENSRNQLESQNSKTLDANALKASGTSLQDIAQLDTLQKNMSGSSIIDKLFVNEGVVGLNLNELMKNPGGKHDLKLEEGDVIYVPREFQTVRVLGQVLFPTIVQYNNGNSLKEYISSSGGFTENANRSKVFVLYANGSARSTKSFLGIKTYPKIEPGARIVVPEKPLEIKARLTAGELVGILTSITSVSALVYSIIVNTNNTNK
ncbi:MAG TPA: SLBB domain-containing protein [Paludibacter sp.]|nr:SLBB domain-containing protein [Paludibacter sp.]